jgi:hypothetical protein
VPSSESLPLFEKTCGEVLSRLQGDASPQADAFAMEAQQLLNTLQLWKKDVPPPTERSETITKVMDLYRRAMEYLVTAKTDPPPA